MLKENHVGSNVKSLVALTRGRKAEVFVNEETIL